MLFHFVPLASLNNASTNKPQLSFLFADQWRLFQFCCYSQETYLQLPACYFYPQEVQPMAIHSLDSSFWQVGCNCLLWRVISEQTIQSLITWSWKSEKKSNFCVWLLLNLSFSLILMLLIFLSHIISNLPKAQYPRQMIIFQQQLCSISLIKQFL